MSAGSVAALVHICGAGSAGKARWAGTGVGVPWGVTGGTIAARLGGAVVHLLALVAPEARGALTTVSVEGKELAGGAVHAGVGVAGVGHSDLAQRRLVTHRAAAVELGTRHREDHVASAAVLAARARAVTTRVQVLTIFTHIFVRALARGLSSGIGDTGAAVLARVRGTRYKTMSR